MKTVQNNTYTLPFKDIHMSQVSQVGGKNTSLGEMFTSLAEKGVLIPDGFATTNQAYQEFLHYNHLHDKIQEALNKLDTRV